MHIVWNTLAVGLVALVAGAVIAGGEPAQAELRLVEASTAAAAVIGAAGAQQPAAAAPGSAPLD